MKTGFLVGLLISMLLAGSHMNGMDDTQSASAPMSASHALLKASYALNRRVDGWALTDVLIHAGASAAVGGLAGPWAGALFAVMPVAAAAHQSVAYRGTSLAALLTLWALWLAHRGYVKSGWALFLVALVGVKEDALALLATRWNRRMTMIAVGLCLALLPMIMSSRGASSLGALVWHGRLYASSIATHALPALIGMRLSADPSPEYYGVTELMGWLALGLIGYAAYESKDVGLRLAFGALAIRLLDWKVSGDILFDHRLYLVAAGMCIALGPLLARRPFTFTEKWSAVPVIALICLFALMTLQRNVVYSSPILLWTEARDLAPDAFRPANNLAVAKWQAGDRAGAMSALTPWIKTMPVARHNLAFMYASVGDVATASRLLDQ